MNEDQTYADQIKQLITAAMSDGIVFTDKDMCRINAEARSDASAEAVRQQFSSETR